MTRLESIQLLYQQTIVDTNSKLSEIQNRIYRISSVRILLFLAGIAGIIYFFSSGWSVILPICLLTFIPFLALVKYHNRLFYRKEYLGKKIKVYQDELSAISHDFSPFDGGKEFTNPAHSYSFDLDLFGNHSLFQLINRTTTVFGKTRLKDWFIHPLTDKEKIEIRQEAIRELALELKFRQRFRIVGLLYKGENADREEIEQWVTSPNSYLGKKKYQFLLYLIPLTNLILWCLAFAGILSFNWPSLAFVLFVIGSFAFQKNISSIQSMYGKKFKIMATYAKLMKLIEEKEMDAIYLREIQSKLKMGNQSASVALNRLSADLHILDQRNNMLLSTIMDGLFFWQLRQVMRIESWKSKHAPLLPDWLEAVGEMDAIHSLATFAYNHPEYAYPSINDKKFVLNAKNMGHPLMNRNKCVTNDLEMSKRPFFIIITGANMAGKSTYLRTLGVNYLLACMGTPVFASSMEIYPVQLITSLRTSDSLTDDESYFFAELKRLKMIIDKLNAGEELFIILDEILKGTNSVDKQKGSFGLIKQFIRLNTNGIIATHDLQLGKLKELFPENIRNYCFEADITENELTFSYRLREGIAQNMNACFLMEKMGITITND